MSKPRVSIGMPVFNGQAYIAEAVDSLLAQTFADFELVIGDNASTDRTEQLCRAYATQDSRVRYHRHDVNTGAGPNHNFVFERSCGEYFKWASYDDICAPTLLERCVEVLDRRQEVVVAYPRTRLIDGDGSVMGNYQKPFPWKGATPQERLANLIGRPLGSSMLHKCYPIYGLMRADVLRKTPLIAPFNSSDATLLAELALWGEYFEVPEYLFSSRRHAGSSLSANTTPAEVAAWFEPSMGSRFPAPQTRLLLGYAGAVRRVPMSAGQRLASARVLGGWLLHERSWRVIGGELKIKAQEFSRSVWRRPVRG